MDNRQPAILKSCPVLNIIMVWFEGCKYFHVYNALNGQEIDKVMVKGNYNNQHDVAGEITFYYAKRYLSYVKQKRAVNE